MTAEKILIVEDDIADVGGTIDLLEIEGIQADVVASVRDAEESLRKRCYQVLLVDWTLPVIEDGPADTDGGGKLIQSLEAGRLGNLNTDIPIFVLTKQTDQFDSQRRSQTRAIPVLSKLDALTIVARVVGALAKPKAAA